MLVLSRRTHQEIVFSNLGIRVQVLQIRGKIAKIGIHAPRNIRVERPESMGSAEADVPGEAGDRDHQLRNEVNLLQLRLEVIQRRLEQGEEVDAESTLRGLLEDVNAFDRQLAPLPILAGTQPAFRLLVVEDCDNERKLMAYVLASHGFEVHVARDGAEALEWLRQSRILPDVVLMDVQMPFSNGLDALDQIRHSERLSDLPVFAVTGSKRIPEAEPVGHGWDGWFSKPLDVRQLIASLQATRTPHLSAPVESEM